MNDNQTDQPAKTGAKVASADWVTKLKLRGDLSLRHKNTSQQAAPARDRQRVRQGLDAEVNDTLSPGFQIATSDGVDPRSTNATLTDSNPRRSLRLVQAFVD